MVQKVTKGNKRNALYVIQKEKKKKKRKKKKKDEKEGRNMVTVKKVTK